MKRILSLWVALMVCSAPALRAQDAATEERLNRLSGQIENLLAGQEALVKRIDALHRDVETLRNQLDKPTGNFAGQEDLKRVADAVKEVDRKRIDDYDKIKSDLLALRKTLQSAAPPSRRPVRETPSEGPSERSGGSEKGFEYTVKKDDTLSVIVQAFREKSVKITTDQVLKANPGLDAKKLKVGQKIFIPAPQS